MRNQYCLHHVITKSVASNLVNSKRRPYIFLTRVYSELISDKNWVPLYKLSKIRASGLKNSGCGGGGRGGGLEKGPPTSRKNPAEAS